MRCGVDCPSHQLPRLAAAQNVKLTGSRFSVKEALERGEFYDREPQPQRARSPDEIEGEIEDEIEGESLPLPLPLD